MMIILTSSAFFSVAGVTPGRAPFLTARARQHAQASAMPAAIFTRDKPICIDQARNTRHYYHFSFLYQAPNSAPRIIHYANTSAAHRTTSQILLLDLAPAISQG